MTDRTVPERIWATPEDGYCTATNLPSDKRDALGFIEYVTAAALEAAQERIRELEMALNAESGLLNARTAMKADE